MTRRITLAALTAAVAGLALAPVASAQLGKALRISRNNQPPPFPFDPAEAPPAPDYAGSTNWASLPSIRDDADVTPAGVPAAAQMRAPADVFFIYPTVLMSRTQWNADTADRDLNRRIAQTTLRNQASVFNGCCAVYAPRYRQMTLGGYIKWSPDSEAATELAYSDILRAFREFRRRTGDRPFILAGHSQGSRLARLLIEREIDGRPVARRMVAAYLPGHWIEADWFRALRTTRACTAATDTGCVVTWSSFEEGRRAGVQRVQLGLQSRYRPETIRRPYTCINPLSWTTAATPVPARANLGAWVYGSGSTPRRPDIGLVSARCGPGDGLYVSKPGEPYAAGVIPFGNHHNNDYQLVWMNVRRNAADRVAAFLRQPR